MILRPDFVPVILVKGNRDTPFLDKEKLLIPPDYTGLELYAFVRNRMEMLPGQALFLMCSDKLVTQHITARELAHKYTDVEDDFLYIHYCLEHTFG